jgi:hypothetical protein
MKVKLQVINELKGTEPKIASVKSVVDMTFCYSVIETIFYSIDAIYPVKFGEGRTDKTVISSGGKNYVCPMSIEKVEKIIDDSIHELKGFESQTLKPSDCKKQTDDFEKERFRRICFYVKEFGDTLEDAIIREDGEKVVFTESDKNTISIKGVMIGDNVLVYKFKKI